MSEVPGNVRGTADALAVAYTLCVAATLGIFAALVWRRRALLYTQLRSPRWVVAQLVFGVVWLVASVVAHDRAHVPGVTVRPVRPGGCTLWSFWLEYVVGAAAWGACVLVALDAAHCVFNLVRRQSATRRAAVVAGALLPAVFAATLASLSPSNDDGCGAPLAPRVLLVLSMAADYVWGLILVAATCRARPHFREYRLLLHAICVAGVFSVPIVLLTLREDARQLPQANLLVMALEATLLCVFSAMSTLPLLGARPDLADRWLQLEEEPAPLDTLERTLAHSFARFHFFEYVRRGAAGTHLVAAHERATWWRALSTRAERSTAALATAEELQRRLDAYDTCNGGRSACCTATLAMTLQNTWPRAERGDAAAFDATIATVVEELAAYHDTYKTTEWRAFYESQTAVRDENAALRETLAEAVAGESGAPAARADDPI